MKRQTVLYIGWVGYNNLGDELMWELFRYRFEANEQWRDFDLVPSGPGVPTDDMSAYDSVVLGGGSLLIPGYIDLAHDALRAGKPVCIWGSGHDRLGADPLLEPRPDWLDASTATKLAETVDGARYCGVRGPLTRRLLEVSGVPMSRVIVSGDPGLLLPGRRQHPIGTNGDAQPEPPQIGINWGTTYRKLLGGDEMHAEDGLAAAAREWLRLGYRLYLYPVWGQDREPLRRLAGKIGDDPRVVVEPDVLDVGPLTDKLAACRFTVNFKLHANLLSYAADVPFVCIGYRFKCFDFVRSVDLSDFIVPTDAPRFPELLLETASRLEAHREQALERMRGYRGLYRPRLNIPFEQSLFIP